MREQLGVETRSVERSDALIDARGKIVKLVRCWADLSDTDVAKIACEPIEFVREVRASLERRHA